MTAQDLPPEMELLYYVLFAGNVNGPHLQITCTDIIISHV